MVQNAGLRTRSNPIGLLDEGLTGVGSPDELVARNRMRQSKVFVFDGAMISIDLMKGGIDFAQQLAQHGLLALPFDNICMQIGPVEEDPDDHEMIQVYGVTSHLVISAWRDADRVYARLYWVGQTGAMSGGRVTYEMDLKSSLADWRRHGSTICIPDKYPAPRTPMEIPASIRKVKEEMPDFENAGAQLCGAWLFSALGVINSAGVDQTHIPAPRWLNAKREKKGKGPIYGFNWVTIDTSSLKIPGVSLGGNHAPPRLHWRRGHVRRLRSGVITTVRPCLVGDVTRGAVDKSYRVRA